jgi:hypothetical protein
MIEVKNLTETQKDEYLEALNKIMALESRKDVLKTERTELQTELNEQRKGLDDKLSELDFEIKKLWEDIKTGQIALELFQNNEETPETTEDEVTVDRSY